MVKWGAGGGCGDLALELGGKLAAAQELENQLQKHLMFRST